RAIDSRISGGITEIAGEGAHEVFASPSNADTRLIDIIPTESFDDFVDTAVGLRDARMALITQLTHSEAYRTLIARMLQRGILDYVFHRAEVSEGHRRGVLAHLGITMARRVLPQLERHVATTLARYVDQHAERLAQEGDQVLREVLDDGFVRRAADELWEKLAPQRLDQLFAHIGSYNLEDLIVTGYEFWLKFRKTPYFHAVTRAVVERFFEKYEDQSVRSLIEDMGVTAEMVSVDLRAVVAPLVARALETGYLAERIRARLEPFYGSDQAATILSERPAPG
ncbi:MAG: hypothetical protein MUF54_09985, partial [Polyangiaceae bacterium]|nr:hypothetical protein [Polyangiaceae bacterium]